MAKKDTEKELDKRFRILTDAEKKKIYNLYVKKQMNVVDVREIIGCGANVLRKFLEDEGIKRTKKELYEMIGNSKMRKFSKADRKSIVKEFKSNGGNIIKISRGYDCGYTPILRVLLEEGVDVSDRMKPNSPCLERLYEKFHKNK